MRDYCFEDPATGTDRVQSYRQLHKFEKGQCVYCGEMDRKIDFAKPQNVSKEWAKLFLEQWNRAVELWNGGDLFTREYLWQPYNRRQLERQKEYSAIACVWLIPNRFVEPHCVAEGG